MITRKERVNWEDLYNVLVDGVFTAFEADWTCSHPIGGQKLAQTVRSAAPGNRQETKAITSLPYREPLPTN